MKPFLKTLIICIFCFCFGTFVTSMTIKIITRDLSRYHDYLAQQNQDFQFNVKHLMEQQKWFHNGYIEVYSPGRYLFNGVAAGKFPFIAAHPNLPIGTIVYIKNFENGLFTIVPVLDRKYVIASRVILTISEAVADVINLNPTDRCYIGIVSVPPAYDENFWNEERIKEIRAMSDTKKYRGKRLW